MGKPITHPDGKTPSICIIGAGFSGLTAGIKLKEKLNLTTFTIFDENPDIGGTWLRNTYPGVACDAQSHFYSWSFELNPDWTEAFSSGAEILGYMKRVTKKYDLYPYIKLRTEVKATVWDQVSKEWNVTTQNKQTGKEQVQHFDIVITGTGLLRAPNTPDEFNAFTGTILHSGRWDSSVDLSNKVVGVVGSGASAIQLIPAIVPTVKELHCYQRSPAHVIDQPQMTYSTGFKLICKHFPPLMWLVRVLIFIKHELFHLAFSQNSIASRIVSGWAKGHLEKQVQDLELKRQLKPTFTFGCKRVLGHNEYYPALQMPHVTVHTDKIQEIVGNTIISEDGSTVKLEVLILATGYRTRDYLDPLKIVGQDSVHVNHVWKEDKPSAYLGIMTHSAPNHFLLLGPNTFLGHSSLLFIMECQVNYIVQTIGKMMSRNIKAIRPRQDAEKKYMDEIEAALKKMVWSTGNCDAWYSDIRGNVTALWPYNCLSYWKRTRNVTLADYETC